MHARRDCRGTAGAAGAADEPRGLGADAGARKWVKPARPAFTLGRETYQNGKWIEITYGRPLQRGRDLFGSGADYGKAANDVGTQGFPAPPVWRAGANKSTRLKTEVPLMVGDKTIPPGEYSLFVDLKLPAWTLIVSTWAAQEQVRSEQQGRALGRLQLHGRQGRGARLDEAGQAAVRRRSADVDVPRHEEDGGRIALMWGNTLASTPFTAVK